MTTSSLRVSVVGASHPDLPAAWGSLERRGAVDTPFHSWAWFSALADTPGVARGVRVLLATAGDEPAGLLPVEFTRARGLRVLGLAGSTWLAPAHLDVVAPSATRAEVARAVVTRIGTLPGWDDLDLVGLRPGASLGEAIRSALGPPRLVRRPEGAIPVAYVDLQPVPPAPLIPKSKLRYQIGQGLRRAEKAGGGFTVATEPGEVVRLLDELMDLNVAQFGEASAVFATEERRRFHRLAAERLATGGHARIYRLFDGRRSLALNYTLLWGGRIYSYSIGRALDAELSPGMAVVGQTILAAATEGLREYDMLLGENEYKSRLGTGVRDDGRVRCLRPRARVLYAAARHLAARAVAARSER